MSPIWKLGTLLFVSASVGNTLSYFYPPYGVVDFLWSAPFSQITGFGIFNLADLMWDAGILVFAFAILKGIAARFRIQQSIPIVVLEVVERQEN